MKWRLELGALALYRGVWRAEWSVRANPRFDSDQRHVITWGFHMPRLSEPQTHHRSQSSGCI